MNFYLPRLHALAKQVPAEQVDAFLVTNPVSIFYLTGLAHRSGYLLVSPRKCVVIEVSGVPGPESVESVVEHRTEHDDAAAVGALAKVISQQGVKALGVEGEHLTVGRAAGLTGQLARVELKPTNAAVERLRAVKDPGEVEAIRAAAEVADRAWLVAAVTVTEADTEQSLEESLNAFVRNAGGRQVNARPVRLGLDTDAVGGESETATVGEVSKVTFEFAIDRGYHSRLARSLRSPFPISPSRKNKGERLGHNFTTVFAAAAAVQDAAVARLCEGVAVSEVWGAAREAAAKAGFAEALTGRLGHGVGLGVEELPYLGEGMDGVLKSGMVVHVAPYLSFPGWGGVRIGDDFVIRGDRAIRLGKARRVPPTLTDEK